MREGGDFEYFWSMYDVVFTTRPTLISRRFSIYTQRGLNGKRNEPNGSGGNLVIRRSVSAIEALVPVRCGRAGRSPGFWLSFRGRLTGRLVAPLVIGAASAFPDGDWLAPGSRFDAIEGDAEGDCFIPLTALCVNEGGGRFIFGG